MSEEIKDMELGNTAEEEKERQKESDKAIDDMSLDEPQIPAGAELGARLAKALPDTDLIDIGSMRIMKMMDGSYKVDGTELADLKPEDLIKIDKFLKSKEIE